MLPLRGPAPGLAKVFSDTLQLKTEQKLKKVPTLILKKK